MVIFNFRADRVLELTKAFEEKDFEPFDRKRLPKVRTELSLTAHLLAIIWPTAVIPKTGITTPFQATE